MTLCSPFCSEWCEVDNSRSRSNFGLMALPPFGESGGYHRPKSARGDRNAPPPLSCSADRKKSPGKVSRKREYSRIGRRLSVVRPPKTAEGESGDYPRVRKSPLLAGFFAIPRGPLVNGALAGWGGRDRTSEWRNQKSPRRFDLTAYFSQLVRKVLMSYQRVTSDFPTDPRDPESNSPPATPRAPSQLSAG